MAQDDKDQQENLNADPLRDVIRRQAIELQQLMDECNRLRNELHLCNERNKVVQAKRDTVRAAYAQKHRGL